MNELKTAIENFKLRQELNRLYGKRGSVAWGRWHDAHNIDKVLSEAVEIYYINQLKQKLYATKKSLF